MLDFVKALHLEYPLVVAPMAGGPSSPELVAASCKSGALGSIGAAYLSAQGITDFVAKVRRETDGPLAINLFVSHPQPKIENGKLAAAMRVAAPYRAELGLAEPSLSTPYEENFMSQFEAALQAKPEVLSFVFGLLPAACIKAAKEKGIYLVGTATKLEEARALQDAGVDAVTLQGFEAGGHRGIFDPDAEDPEIGIFALLDQCVPHLRIPLIVAGGIMNAEDIRHALSKGAQAVQMGTAFLACREAGTSKPYRAKLLEMSERKTKTTRAFSGRLARGIENRFMVEMDRQTDVILPFPVQNKFTRDLRAASAQKDSAEFLSLWAGTGKGELWQGSAAELIEKLFK